MILSFRDKRTRAFFEGDRVKAFHAIERQAMLRLDRLHAADKLMALNTPGNRLEGLRGDRKGQYRSEERRVGKECRRLCRSRWSPYH
jgi:proteic killer suppression protein